MADNRNTRYLFAADPGDARSTWVNPGALSLRGTLSVYSDLTFGLEPPYETGSPISQISFGFNSYYFAVAYQFDRLPDPLGSSNQTVHGHAFRGVLWGLHGRLGAGGAATWYSGRSGGVGFDVGVVYRAATLLDLGAVLVNIGQPSVRGTDLKLRLRPAATFHTTNDWFALQAQGELGTERLLGFALGTRVGPVTARFDTDGRFRRQSVSFGLSFGGENRVGALLTAGANLKVPDAASLHLSSERSNQAKPRRGR